MQIESHMTNGVIAPQLLGSHSIQNTDEPDLALSSAFFGIDDHNHAKIFIEMNSSGVGGYWFFTIFRNTEHNGFIVLPMLKVPLYVSDTFFV